MRHRTIVFVLVMLAVCPVLLHGRTHGLEAGTARGGTTEPLDLPVMGSGDLRFFVDTSVFRGPEGLSRQEVYLLIDIKQLDFVAGPELFVGELKLTASVVDSGGASVVDRSWSRKVAVDSLEVLADASAPYKDVVGFDLEPGSYCLTFLVEDAGSGRRGTCEKTLEVRDFDRTGLQFSDVELAAAVERAGEQSRFVKQGWKVMPNITRNYLVGKPVSVYFELYNFLEFPERSEDSFILGYSLVDSTGRAVRRYPAKRVLKPGESIAKAEILETEGLSAGAYDVQIEAFDGGSREYVRVRRPVFVAPEPPPEPLTQIQRDLLRYYADIRHVADGKTLREYGKLQDWPSKAKLLRAFWKGLDPTPDTPRNERLYQHFFRISYSENRFDAGPKRRGSDTDRGRIFIRYGPPDDVDYHTSAAGYKPYEVWIYEEMGRSEFVFRDRRGAGIYKLVHSTHPQEVYNPDWWTER